MFTLDQVVPWGRSFDEYSRMFALDRPGPGLRILGCADGPASFNAEATRAGARVVSCDPLYQSSGAEIRERIRSTSEQVLEQTRRNAQTFVWTAIRSIEQLRALRLSAMDDFLRDYEAGGREGRYVAAELPALPFADQAFDIALCSHFLFLYTSHLTEQFHVQAVLEMCRVAREVRVFPLLTLDGVRSLYVEAIARELGALGRATSIERVPYEFQRGGNEMMRIGPQ